MTNILILNDFVSKGKIAGNMMATVLAYKNFNTYFIPSALISNNFSFGKVAKLDTFAYIKESLDVYEDLGFDFDIVFIGYVEDKKTCDLIIDFIANLDNKPLVILDPIMADNGKLYKGVDIEKIDNYKRLLEIADIIIPNFTEANFLGLDDYDKLCEDSKKYVITSLTEDDRLLTLGIDTDLHKVYFETVDIKVAGTGDLFDAIFICKYIETNDFKGSIDFAVKKMTQILNRQKNDHPDTSDIFIESYLELLD